MIYKHKYDGYFTKEQVDNEKKELHKLMYWLLVYKDPNTNDKFKHVNIDLCVKNIVNRLQGFSSLLDNPNELVTIMTMLESALLETKKETFDFKNYRKIVLDAHAMLDKFGDNND